MKTILNTIHRILPVLNIGTYHGSFDAYDVIDDDQINEDFNEGYINYTSEQYWNGFSNQLYMARLMESSQSILIDAILPVLIELGIGITGAKVIGIDSPKEYNFRDDYLEFELHTDNIRSLQDNLIILYNAQDISKMREFFKENYGSYSGFISFMSSSPGMVLEGIEEGKEDEICQFIYYLMKEREVFEDWNYFLAELFYQDFTYCEFLTDDFIEQYKNGGTDVVSLVQNNYLSHNIDELINMVTMFFDRKPENDMGESQAHVIALRTIKGIESNTLELQF